MTALLTIWRHLLATPVDLAVTALGCLLAGAVWRFMRCATPAPRWWRVSLLAWLGCLILTGGLYAWRLPRGLAGDFYGSGFWRDSVLHVPATGAPFTFAWEGAIQVPSGVKNLKVESNASTVLLLDDRPVQMPPARLDVGTPAARKYLLDGWSRDEVAGDGATTFVWNDEAQASVDLGVRAAGAYQLQLRALAFDDQTTAKQDLTVMLNGVAAGVVTVQKGPRWQNYLLPVPAAALPDKLPGIVRVVFQPSYLTPPTATETRALGVAFDRLELRQIAAAPSSASKTSLAAAFTPGIHRLTLRGQSDGRKPFLRLTWIWRDKASPVNVRTDECFPHTRDPAALQRRLSLEQWMFGGLLGMKFVLLGGWSGMLLNRARRRLSRTAYWQFGVIALIGAVNLALFIGWHEYIPVAGGAGWDGYVYDQII